MEKGRIENMPKYWDKNGANSYNFTFHRGKMKSTGYTYTQHSSSCFFFLFLFEISCL